MLFPNEPFPDFLTVYGAAQCSRRVQSDPILSVWNRSYCLHTTTKTQLLQNAQMPIAVTIHNHQWGHLFTLPILWMSAELGVLQKQLSRLAFSLTLILCTRGVKITQCNRHRLPSWRCGCWASVMYSWPALIQPLDTSHKVMSLLQELIFSTHNVRAHAGAYNTLPSAWKVLSL